MQKSLPPHFRFARLGTKITGKYPNIDVFFSVKLTFGTLYLEKYFPKNQFLPYFSFASYVIMVAEAFGFASEAIGCCDSALNDQILFLAVILKLGSEICEVCKQPLFEIFF